MKKVYSVAIVQKVVRNNLVCEMHYGESTAVQVALVNVKMPFFKFFDSAQEMYTELNKSKLNMVFDRVTTHHVNTIYAAAI
ncbi:hypothetical protein PC41400_07935 [Paenibacillus chitinolyticus]|uniref:Uncharacterized protein n=1 Tax=Paenibacillus chitinolyticus TaxID=79263 RepID=A0A410WT95_9BACL|nr:hypothetical protein [Paenibacillus chitinolyticus]MCY9588647.1 hypothetical protein [Paenibacillus chitinolyticus]MCY9595849.1 hypothetical protein [Paenibacillus chitinolyticus]QAV17598.1 hypothetical protein PC41400_07935 [Paenibacillus chitinolyticus]